MKKIYLIFGVAGSGKGTQSNMIKSYFNLEHISVGDLIRAEESKNSKIGKLSKSLAEKGNFLPDNIVDELVLKNLENRKNDIILDGYPRTIEQATTLKKFISERGIECLLINLECGYDDIKERLAKRGRKDDKQEVIEHRIKLYEEKTLPVLCMFSDKIYIDANGTVSEVSNRIISAIKLYKYEHSRN